MIHPVHAIYEADTGVLRLREKLELPDRAEVIVEPRLIAPGTPNLHDNSELFALLNQRFDGGDPEVAAKHNEHQP